MNDLTSFALTTISLLTAMTLLLFVLAKIDPKTEAAAPASTR